MDARVGIVYAVNVMHPDGIDARVIKKPGFAQYI
jgi:hypothetical protein